jgi:hypothetical protein
VPLLSWINPTSRTRASRPPVTITAIDSPMPLTRHTSSCRSTTVASAQYPFGKTPVEGICIALTTFAIVAGMSPSEAAPIGNAVPHGMALPPHESSRQPASPSQNQINVVTERRHQTRTVAPPRRLNPHPSLGSIQCTGRAGDRFREASFGACREEREVGCDGKHLRRRIGAAIPRSPSRMYPPVPVGDAQTMLATRAPSVDLRCIRDADCAILFVC